ncbi:MAG: AMP-binding protein [Halioglobus sp.]
MNLLQSSLQSLALQSPQHIVLESEHGSLTAAQLHTEVEQLSKDLKASAASCVGLFAGNSVAWVLLDLASQIAGICLVPIPTFFSDQQVLHALNSAAVDTVFCDGPGAARLEALLGTQGVPVEGLDSMSRVSLKPVVVAQIPEGTNKITFTSGSTGEPKGVCLSLEQCLNVAQSLAGAVGEDKPHHLCVLPLSTLLENIGGLYRPILQGGTALVYSAETMGMAGSSGIEADLFLAAITRLQPHTMILVPQILALLDVAMTQGWVPPVSLKFVAVGGGRVAPEIVSRVRAAGLPVYEGYGLSESASVVSLNSPDADRSATSGRVLPHVKLKERNGELVVSGNTFLGYLNQPDTWGKDEVATGDLGHIDADGFVTISGRKKNLLVSSFGRNISPEWVESELLASGLLHQAVVIGDDRPHCAALVWSGAPNFSHELMQQEITRVNSRLPDYARILAVTVMPQPLSVGAGMLTDNGRVRRDCIANHYRIEIDNLYRQQQEQTAP